MKIGPRLVQIAIIIVSTAAFAADWEGHEQNLRGLEGAIRSLRAEITSKIQESSLTIEPEKKRALMAEIIHLEEELADEKEKMQNELRHIKYEHPERGQDFKSLSADFNLDLPALLSAAPHLERLLVESKALIQRVYGSSAGSSVRQPASSEQASSPEVTPPRWVLEK